MTATFAKAKLIQNIIKNYTNSKQSFSCVRNERNSLKNN